MSRRKVPCGFHRKPCPKLCVPGALLSMCLGPSLSSRLQPPFLLSHGRDCSLRCCLGSGEAFFPPFIPCALPLPPKIWIKLGAAPRQPLVVVTASAFRLPSLTPSSAFLHGLWLVRGLRAVGTADLKKEPRVATRSTEGQIQQRELLSLAQESCLRASLTPLKNR